MSTPLPPNEEERCAALRATGLLDTAPDAEFDEICRLAAQVCHTPIAAISLVDGHRQWFKSRIGPLPRETSRDNSFCAQTILEPTRPLVLNDARANERFARSVLVTQEPFVRFYAGAPLLDHRGLAIGALCVMDTTPRTLDAEALEALLTLARQVARLIESRRLVRQLAEQKAALDEHALVAITDPRGRITYANDRFCAVSQYAHAELVGQDHRLINSGLHPKEFFRELWDTIRSGRVWRGEIRNRAKDGSLYWVNTTIVPIVDAQGEIVEYVSIRADITAQKCAEAELQRQKSELQVLFDLMPAMVWFKDTRNNHLRVNQRAAAALGRRVEEIEGRPCREVNPAEADRFHADDLEVIHSGAPKLGIIESLRDREGRELWVQTDKVPYRDATGHVAGIVVMAQDITERRRSEERLHLLSSALEQCKDSIVITDAQLGPPGPRIQFVNPAFTAMTGYAAAEVIGRTLEFQQGARSNPAALERLVRALAKGQASQDEMISYRKDGSSFDLEWNVTPVRDAAGTVTHFVGIQRDVTARNSAAADLVRAREEALESGRLKSRFLANMSHELRTPLNTINGLAATLLEQELPEHLTSPLKLILQCGETQLQNIQTILTHSSLESGRFSLESRPFSPAEVALNALRIAGEKARRKGLVLDFFLDPAMPAVVDGDAFRLQQVLVNFLANAIKFTDAGRVCLRVRALHSPEGRIDLRFIVADTGVGIPADEVGSLFEPFAQADSSGKRRFEGTGLGLAISKTLVDLMGGSIGVRSRVGRGSFFYFTVPFLLETLPRALGAATAHASLANHQVLIEEPRPLRRRMLADLAHAWRMRAVFVRDAAAFAAAAAERPFDFAIRTSAPDTGPAVPGDPLPVVWLSPTATPAAHQLGNYHLTDLFSAAELSAALAALLSAEAIASAAPLPDSAPRKIGERIPLRILSADDIATNRDMLRFMCRHLGYATDLVTDGVELLERLAAQPYDLLLIDVNMPRMDGLAAAREICRRQPDPAKRPRLVAVTANALAGDRERCLAAGMDDYLAKPLIPKNLVACIERLFTEKPATTPPTPAAPAEPAAPPLVDRGFLGDITAGMEPADANALIGEMRDSVIRDYDALRAPLAAACTARDAHELEKIVHGLKGCFLSVGWARLGGRCATAMGELRAGKFQDWATLPAEIHALQQQSAAELAQVLRPHASSPAAPCDQIVTAENFIQADI